MQSCRKEMQHSLWTKPMQDVVTSCKRSQGNNWVMMFFPQPVLHQRTGGEHCICSGRTSPPLASYRQGLIAPWHWAAWSKAQAIPKQQSKLCEDTALNLCFHLRQKWVTLLFLPASVTDSVCLSAGVHGAFHSSPPNGINTYTSRFYSTTLEFVG